MPLPPTVRVKLSSEAAGSISLTPVVVQELATRELVEHVLAVTGKDPPRLREILQRGSFVSGASRFRWAGWDPDPDGLRDLLATFPDPDPLLVFTPQRCLRALLRGGRQIVEVSREAAARTAFWDLLMEMAASGSPVYAGYSYHERADRFLRDFSASEADRLRSACAAIRYSTLREQIRTTAWTRGELHAARTRQPEET